MDQEFVSQATSAAVVVYSLRLLEYWFPWMVTLPHQGKIVLAAVGAVVSAIGVHYTFDVEAGTLTVIGLTAAGLLHGTWHAIQQFAAQQILHDWTK